jgi:hypothetical protein
MQMQMQNSNLCAQTHNSLLRARRDAIGAQIVRSLTRISRPGNLRQELVNMKVLSRKSDCSE